MVALAQRMESLPLGVSLRARDDLAQLRATNGLMNRHGPEALAGDHAPSFTLPIAQERPNELTT